MMNTLNPCTAPAFGTSGRGTGLASAGSAHVAIAAYAGAPMTLAAVRQDDAKVPDPRGRQR
ncbi:MAG: hypothetical protein ACXVGH_12885 [Mycobacteriales bacterium]